MIHTYQIEGITLQTGDIICTMNGKPDILPGEFWLLVGRLVPGDVDHVAIYTGPQGRCVEAGTHGVIKYTVFDGQWNTERMARRREPVSPERHGGTAIAFSPSLRHFGALHA